LVHGDARIALILILILLAVDTLKLDTAQALGHLAGTLRRLAVSVLLLSKQLYLLIIRCFSFVAGSTIGQRKVGVLAGPVIRKVGGWHGVILAVRLLRHDK